MKEKKINKIKKPLESLPEIIDTKDGPINVHQLLRELDDEKDDLFTMPLIFPIKKDLPVF
jgi:hypothetical protein